MREPALLDIVDVTVRYGRRDVLSGVSMHVAAGEVVGIRGRNGAGKSTLLRVAANVFRPRRGRRSGPLRCAYVPATMVPPPLTVRSWLALMPRPTRTDVRPVLEQLAFDGRMTDACRALSFGNYRKLLLTEALTAGRELVVIDEASVGLDDAGLAGLHQVARQFADAGGALVIADQDSQPIPCASRILRVTRGSLVVDGPDDHVVSITMRGPASNLPRLLDRAAEIGFSESSR